MSCVSISKWWELESSFGEAPNPDFRVYRKFHKGLAVTQSHWVEITFACLCLPFWQQVETGKDKPVSNPNLKTGQVCCLMGHLIVVERRTLCTLRVSVQQTHTLSPMMCVEHAHSTREPHCTAQRNNGRSGEMCAELGTLLTTVCGRWLLGFFCLQKWAIKLIYGFMIVCNGLDSSHCVSQWKAIGGHGIALSVMKALW